MPLFRVFAMIVSKVRNWRTLCVRGLGAFVHVDLGEKPMSKALRSSVFSSAFLWTGKHERVDKRFRVCYVLTRLM